MVSSNECCICYEKFNDNTDNTNATSCNICKNKICIICYDKSTELLMKRDKFDKIVNNCCICRIETKKTNFNDFSKEQLQHLLITAYEKINKSQLETLEYKNKYNEIENINIKTNTNLTRFIENTKLILENKKLSKNNIKIMLEGIVNNIGIL